MSINLSQFEYTVEIKANNIIVKKHFFKYKNRMDIVLSILKNYYDPNDIIIVDKYGNKTKLKNYY